MVLQAHGANRASRSAAKERRTLSELDVAVHVSRAHEVLQAIVIADRGVKTLAGEADRGPVAIMGASASLSQKANGEEEGNGLDRFLDWRRLKVGLSIFCF